MKKNKRLLLTKIIHFLVLIWTIITLIIVYNNVHNNIASKFVIGYALFALLMLLYIPIIILFNIRKLKYYYIKKVLKKFIFSFIIFFLFKYVFEYIFNHSNIDILDVCFDAMRLSFGTTLVDAIFLKEEKELE